MARNGLKMGSFHLFVQPKQCRIIFGKTHFLPILTHVRSQSNQFSRHFVTLVGPKWFTIGSNRAHFICLGTPNGLGSFLENPIFDPLLTHFLSQNKPFSRHFGILGGPKRATTNSKCAKKHLFWHSMWSTIIFDKSLFFLHPVDLVDPFWHPPLWATSCSLPQPIAPRYRGLGVGWGDFEG